MLAVALAALAGMASGPCLREINAIGAELSMASAMVAVTPGLAALAEASGDTIVNGAQPPGTVMGRISITEQGEVIASKYGNPAVAEINVGTMAAATSLASLEPPCMDLLNELQIDRIRRRAGEADARISEGIHLTINGIVAGLRNSG